MNALKTAILWPLSVAQSILTITSGALIAITPLCFRILTRGLPSLRKFTDLFQFFDGLPLGRELFSSIIYLFAPYSTNIGSSSFLFHLLISTGCTVKKLTFSEEVISSEITIQDRPWLRNPFGSIHAIALANLGELTSGLCLMSAMQHIPRKGIPVRIDTIYHRKARGIITGTCTISLKKLMEVKSSSEFIVETILTDSKGLEVAKTSVTWSMKEVSSEKKIK